MNTTITELLDLLKKEIESAESIDSKIGLLNDIRKELHSISPLKHHHVDCVLWVKSDDVEPNDYNPNSIPPPEQELLHESIANDGYTMSIVTFNDPDGKIKIVDGFHRRLMIQIHDDIKQSTHDYVPLTFIRTGQEGKGDRMASTIRHNRARGSHNIELMSTIVSELVEMGKGDAWICKHIGMSKDELLRMKQITGLASLFQNKDFSEAWEADSIDENDTLETEGKA